MNNTHEKDWRTALMGNYCPSPEAMADYKRLSYREFLAKWGSMVRFQCEHSTIPKLVICDYIGMSYSLFKEKYSFKIWFECQGLKQLWEQAVFFENAKREKEENDAFWSKIDETPGALETMKDAIVSFVVESSKGSR